MKIVGLRPKTPEKWNWYPENIKERALNMKPGMAPIEYGFDEYNTLEDSFPQIEKYLDRYENSPISTDFLYLAKILRNKIFRGELFKSH